MLGSEPVTVVTPERTAISLSFRQRSLYGRNDFFWHDPSPMRTPSLPKHNRLPSSAPSPFSFGRSTTAIGPILYFRLDPSPMGKLLATLPRHVKDRLPLLLCSHISFSLKLFPHSPEVLCEGFPAPPSLGPNAALAKKSSLPSPPTPPGRLGFFPSNPFQHVRPISLPAPIFAANNAMAVFPKTSPEAAFFFPSPFFLATEEVPLNPLSFFITSVARFPLPKKAIYSLLGGLELKAPYFYGFRPQESRLPPFPPTRSIFPPTAKFFFSSR